MSAYKIDKKVFYSKLWSLALPIAFQSLMGSAVAVGDALMLGNVGQTEMTAVSLATQIQFVQFLIIFGATSAGSILGAQYFGKGDHVTLKKIFNLMIRFSSVVSLVFFLACMFIPDLLMMIFTDSETLIGIGSDYLRIAGFSYLINGVSQCYLAMMKVTDHVKVSVVISCTAVLGNIGLNAVFIFGMFGIPAMGARGAAVATLIASAIELALCFIVSSGKGHVRPDLNFFKSKKGLTRDFIKQLLPLLGGSLLWGVGFTSYTAIIGHMGEDAAAANSVTGVMRELISCLCNGIGNAAAIMIGNELGAGDLEKGKAYGLKLKNISWIIGAGSSLVVIAVIPLLKLIVKLNDESAQYLTGMMLITAFYMIGRCVNTITINGVLDGGGDTVFDFVSLFITMWCIAVPLAILGAFVFNWHVYAVYACTCLDEVGKIPWVMARVRKYKWVRNLTR